MKSPINLMTLLNAENAREMAEIDKAIADKPAPKGWTMIEGDKPADKPMRLRSGRIVNHTRQSNGSQLAEMADGGDMDEAEWQEYCRLNRIRHASIMSESEARSAHLCVGCGHDKDPADRLIVCWECFKCHPVEPLKWFGGDFMEWQKHVKP